MECINNVITRYQQCIGKYDKQIWEQAIERETHKKPQSAPRKMAKVNPDLIDVDLFRTSPFSKSKPQQSWLTACRKALPRVILFPFYCRWWLRTTSHAIFSLLINLYLVQFFILVLSYIHNGYSFLSESMSVAHILSPCIMLFLLAVIHVQVVSTYESSSQYSRFKSLNAAMTAGSTAAATDAKQLRRQQTRQKDGKIRKKCERKVLVNGTADAESTGSLDTGIDLDVRQNSGSRHGSAAETRRQGHGRGVVTRRLGNTAETRHSSTAETRRLCNSEVTHRHGNTAARHGNTKAKCRHGNSEASCRQISARQSSEECAESEMEVVDLNLQIIDRKDSTMDWVCRHSTSQICDVLNDNVEVRCLETFSERGGVRNKKPIITFTKPQHSSYKRAVNCSNPSKEILLDDLKDPMDLNLSTSDRQNCIIVEGLQDNFAKSNSGYISARSSSLRRSSAIEFGGENLETYSELNLSDLAFHDNDFSDQGLAGWKKNTVACCSHYCCKRDLCHHPRSLLNTGCIESDDSECGDQDNSHLRGKGRGGKLKYSKKSAEVDVSFDCISIVNSNSSVSNTCDSSLHSSDGEETSPNEARNLNLQCSQCKMSKLNGSPARNVTCNHVKRGLAEDRQRRCYKTGQMSRDSLTDCLNCTSLGVECRPDFAESSSNEHKKVMREDGVRGRKEDLKAWSKDEEEEDAGNTEDVSSGSDGTSVTCSSSGLSARDVYDEDDQMNGNASQGIQHASSILNSLASTNDRVSCMIWDSDGIHKVNLSVLDIGFTIIQKVDSLPESCHYLFVGIFFSILTMMTPLAYRIYHGRQDITAPLSYKNLTNLYTVAQIAMGDSWCESAIVLSGLVQRFFLSLIFFFLLSVAERTFKQRLLYAKNFCYLTSSRRAKKYDLPHFRLNKVRNIKTWLSLRSFLKKRGPQRSVECIVSAAFLITVIILSIVCLEMLQDYDSFLDYLGNWELAIWCMFLGIYLLRFMTLGTKINQKYRNFSLLITEQMNLYLHMEQKPHKKDELMVANSVLRLAEELLKELESPFKISGLSANPLLYNITKVVVLSAFSAVLTDMLGFKLKLYKIKLKS